MGISTVHEIVKEVGEVMWDVLSLEYMHPPSTAQDWKSIAEGFEWRWQFPHCCGALDSKHCIIQAPSHSGSLYWNYKKSFSIVLLALVDSKYRFIIVNVGAAGMEEIQLLAWHLWMTKFLSPHPRNYHAVTSRLYMHWLAMKHFQVTFICWNHTPRSQNVLQQKHMLYSTTDYPGHKWLWSMLLVWCLPDSIFSWGEWYWALKLLQQLFLAKPNDPVVQSFEAKLNADLDKECEEKKG